MSKLVFRSINASTAPKPVGPYSSAVQVDKMLYLSGMIGIESSTGKLIPGGMIPETQQTFENIKAVLEEAGSSFQKVATVKIFVDDITQGAAINDIYKKYIQSPFPARCMMQVSKLPLGAKIEVEVTAVLTDQCRL